MSEQQQAPKIFIKKYKKGGEGAHGGSWKVAYADFVTAMMAFFLLMWLINMAPSETKKEVASYFQEFSIFESKGNSAIEMKPSGQNQIEMGKPQPGQGGGNDAQAQAERAMKEQDFMRDLQEEIKREYQEFADQVVFNVTEAGLRIDITDTDNNPLFPSGSSVLNPRAKELVDAITTKLVTQSEVKVAIEGHTDSKPYTSKSMSNWDLSAERALSARREMSRIGMPDERIVRVAGYASAVPLIKDNPEDAKNRRLSLMLFFATGKAPELPPPPTRTVPAPPTTPAQADPVERYIQDLYGRSK